MPIVYGLCATQELRERSNLLILFQSICDFVSVGICQSSLIFIGDIVDANTFMLTSAAEIGRYMINEYSTGIVHIVAIHLTTNSEFLFTLFFNLNLPQRNTQCI